MSADDGRLFDDDAGVQARELALQRVEENADAEWLADARSAVRNLAERVERFTTDRVWYVLDRSGAEPPREPRALGAVMRAAVREGWITPTDEHRESKRAANHRRPVRVWRSLLCDDEATRRGLSGGSGRD